VFFGGVVLFPHKFDFSLGGGSFLFERGGSVSFLNFLVFWFSSLFFFFPPPFSFPFFFFGSELGRMYLDQGPYPLFLSVAPSFAADLLSQKSRTPRHLWVRVKSARSTGFLPPFFPPASPPFFAPPLR